jgi:hypothetical protein
MTKTYVTYDQSDLRSYDLAKLAALFNGRANGVRREQAMYRSAYGELFEVLVNLPKKTIKAYSLTGVIVGEWMVVDDNVEVVIGCIEFYARLWTDGGVRCSDCGTTMLRFSAVAGRYMSGVYCKTCWPKYEAMKTREVD